MENRVAQSDYKLAGHSFRAISNSPNRALVTDWLAGLVGGFASATICAPLDISRTRHMLLATTKSHGNIDYQGFLHTVSKIYKDEGIRGLYKGYSVTAFSIPAFHSLYFSLFYQAKSSLSQTEMFQNSEVLRNIVASFGAGVICNSLTNPLWVVRTRIQSQFLHQETMPKYTSLFGGLRRICKDEGPKALFKGLGASYFGLSHAVILYPLYEYLKTLIKEWKGTPTGSDIFLASLISKFTAMVLTYPHTVLRARLQDHRGPTFIRRSKQAHAMANGIVNEKATISSVIRNTYKNEGIKGFYAGLRIDLVRVLPANSIMFVMFEFVKKQLEQYFEEVDY